MRATLAQALIAFTNVYSGWILWNLFLAFIPLALSFWLFEVRSGEGRGRNWRSPLWWLAYAVFLAFLPNAPYMLTDVIHLLRGTRDGFSNWIIVLVFIPLHLAAILTGFQAYVLSLLNQSRWLKRQQVTSRMVLGSELLMHALCAIGVYIGRFRRFNSWDLVVDPTNVLMRTFDDLTAKQPFVVIVITFVILTVLYWLFKQITLGLILRIRYARKGIDVLS